MKRKISLIILSIIICITFVGCAGTKEPKNEELYALAVHDAMTIEEGEVFPLVNLTANDDKANFNDNGQVLLLSWHRYPDNYIAGENITNTWGEIWTFTDKEILSWFDNNNKGVTDWDLRFRQLIGVPQGKTYTHFSAVWASLDDVVRPAYESDVTKPMKTSFDKNVDIEFKKWFDGNIVWSYFDSAYPWTRLGYTYDWANNGTEYGVTEFLIQPDSELSVEFTKTTDEFIAWLKAN